MGSMGMLLDETPRCRRFPRLLSEGPLSNSSPSKHA